MAGWSYFSSHRRTTTRSVDDSSTERTMKISIVHHNQPGSPAPVTEKYRWQVWIPILVIVLALGMAIRADLSRIRAVSDLSAQGSPPPKRDANSSSGYVLGQRHFLGTHERGDTYRWIAFTQEVIAGGLFASSIYHGDNSPEGRVQLMPRLY